MWKRIRTQVSLNRWGWGVQFQAQPEGPQEPIALCICNANHLMLKGKRVIVTGASTGIGEQMAYHLAQMGAHVLVTARTEAKLQKVRTKHTHTGHICCVSLCPANGLQSCPAAPRGLDMLILNHVGNSYFNYFDGDVGHVQKLLKINFLSYVAMTVSALPRLKDSGGSIVVVSSMAGKAGFPFTAPYSATKFALDGFFSSLRQELIIQKVDVSITLCVLGFIDTAASDVVLVSPAPKEECALEIIKGGALRQREIYYKYAATKIPLLIRDWAPELLDYLIRRSYNVENLKKN
uniref:11-beta-hydroxysteroid dehydrogenase 1 n=1 Tax=Chelonoidis abingdonii TaxID=106734 RepID=A0A8C0IPS8_CHEAB